MLGITGSAKGASIVITDGAGTPDLQRGLQLIVVGIYCHKGSPFRIFRSVMASGLLIIKIRQTCQINGMPALALGRCPYGYLKQS